MRIKWLAILLAFIPWLVYPTSSKAIIIGDTPVNKKVFLLIFNPTIGSTKLTEYKQWFDPRSITNTLLTDFPIISHNYLNYSIQETQEINGFPKKQDGFQYTATSYLACLDNNSTCHSPDGVDYQNIFTTYNICAKNVDEVWLWGGPWFGYWEFTPVNYCGKTQFVMGFNYERAKDEALHDFGHRMEFVGISRVGDNNWQQNEANEWNKYSLIQGHCGNVHYPPGTIVGQEEYKYNKTTNVSSDCDRYLDYPTSQITAQTINCSIWGCTQYGYVRWWLNHIPSNTGSTTVNGKTIYNNWWKYYAFYEETLPAPTSTPAPGQFSNLLGTFTQNNAYFGFNYSSQAGTYNIDLSTVADMSTDVYLSFTNGSTSPLVERNPIKWDKYSCGRTLYWRVNTSNAISPIQATTVNCTYTTSDVKNILSQFVNYLSGVDKFPDGKINSFDVVAILSGVR